MNKKSLEHIPNACNAVWSKRIEAANKLQGLFGSKMFKCVLILVHSELLQQE